MTRTWTLAALLAAVALAACGDSGGPAATAGSSSGRPELRIGLNRGAGPIQLLNDDDAPLAAAIDAAGGRLSWVGPFASMPEALEALNAGSIDVTSGSITGAIGGLAGGTSELAVFARQSAERDQGIVVKADSDIRSVADLRGRKVAVNRAATGEYLLLQALANAGVDPDDVERVYLKPADAGPAFASGQVDAWATWAVYTSLAKEKYGGRLLVGGAEIGADNDTAYVVRRSLVEQHPELVRALFDALADRAAAARGDVDGTAAIVERTNEVTPAIARVLAVNANTPIEPVDAASVERFQRAADFFLDRGVIPQRVDIAANAVDVTTLRGAR